MSPLQLREWQSRLGYTNRQAAAALGISLQGYSQLLHGIHRTSGRPLGIDTRTALACAAIEAMSADALRYKGDEGDQDTAMPDACRPIFTALIDAISTGPWRPLLPVAQLAQADPVATASLLMHLEAHGQQMMSSSIDALRSMVAREVARKIMHDIESNEGGK